MTGTIPRLFIDDLLNRTDIVEFIDSHIPLKKQGTSFVACCPFHNEKTPSFNVIPKKQFYHCFGCGVSGNAISFAIDYLHQNFPQAIETLAVRAGLLVPREGAPAKQYHSKSLYQLLNQVADFYQNQLKTNAEAARQYLEHRGINDDMVKRFQIGYAPAGWHTLEQAFKTSIKDLIVSGMLIQRDDGQTYSRYRHRVMYPIHDRNGRIIGFGGRSIDETQKPKYLNSPETAIFQKSRELYGLHHILSAHCPITNILIVEGYMDVIALSQFGIPNAVATLGTATSAYHIQLLSKHTKQLIFCFDGDAAGKQAAWRALESCLSHLNTGVDASFIFLPEGHDPDSLIRIEGKEQFLARLGSAVPLNQFFFATLAKMHDITSLAGKSQLINSVKPYLQKMGEGPYQLLIMNELARLTRIETHRLNELLAENSENKQVPQQKTISRTPARIAIALLLQNPDIYQNNRHILTEEVEMSLQQPLLKQVIQLIAKHPEMNTGALIEVFRDTPDFDILTQLAAWDHQVPEAALTKEFLDTVLFLAKQDQENKISHLMIKARDEGLIEDERLQLQKMLKQRHQAIDNKTLTE